MIIVRGEWEFGIGIGKIVEKVTKWSTFIYVYLPLLDTLKLKFYPFLCCDLLSLYKEL